MTTGIGSLQPYGVGRAIIVRAQEPADTLFALRNRRCVVSEDDSSIFETVIRAVLQAPADVCSRFFRSVHLSGSHRQSVEMVAGYEADVAAVDSSALDQLEKLYPALLEKVRIL